MIRDESTWIKNIFPPHATNGVASATFNLSGAITALQFVAIPILVPEAKTIAISGYRILSSSGPTVASGTGGILFATYTAQEHTDGYLYPFELIAGSAVENILAGTGNTSAQGYRKDLATPVNYEVNKFGCIFVVCIGQPSVFNGGTLRTLSNRDVAQRNRLSNVTPGSYATSAFPSSFTPAQFPTEGADAAITSLAVFLHASVRR